MFQIPLQLAQSEFSTIHSRHNENRVSHSLAGNAPHPVVNTVHFYSLLIYSVDLTMRPFNFRHDTPNKTSAKNEVLLYRRQIIMKNYRVVIFFMLMLYSLSPLQATAGNEDLDNADQPPILVDRPDRMTEMPTTEPRLVGEPEAQPQIIVPVHDLLSSTDQQQRWSLKRTLKNCLKRLPWTSYLLCKTSLDVATVVLTATELSSINTLESALYSVNCEGTHAAYCNVDLRNLNTVSNSSYVTNVFAIMSAECPRKDHKRRLKIVINFTVQVSSIFGCSILL